jgi:putative transposase
LIPLEYGSIKKMLLVQSIKDWQKIKGTRERQAKLAINRNAKVRDFLNKSARYIIDHSIKQRILIF